jgi:hypothetical protein
MMHQVLALVHRAWEWHTSDQSTLGAHGGLCDTAPTAEDGFRAPQLICPLSLPQEPWCIFNASQLIINNLSPILLS